MPAYFTAEDLLLNDVFIEYCLAPNPVNTAKWEAVVNDNNISREVIAEARAIFTMLTPGIGNDEIEEEVSKLRDVIYDRETKRRRIISRLSAFAGLLLLISTILFFTLQTSPDKN